MLRGRRLLRRAVPAGRRTARGHSLRDGELTTAKIDRRDFQKLLKSEPGMAVGLLGGLVATVRDIQRELTRM